MKEEVVDGGEAELRELVSALRTHAFHVLHRHSQRLELRPGRGGAADVCRSCRRRGGGRVELCEQLQYASYERDRRFGRESIERGGDLRERLLDGRVAGPAARARELLVNRLQRQRGGRDLVRRADEVLERRGERANQILERRHGVRRTFVT